MKKQIILTGQNMQAIKNLLLLLSIFFLAGCRGDDSEHPIHGQWSLRSYTAGFQQPEKFNMGDVIWTFNPNNRLDVQIQSGIKCRCRCPISIDTSGHYRYSINDDGLKLINNEHEREYEYSIDNNILYISDNPEVDGCLVFFEKINKP